MTRSDDPIGIFDSGLGGLTVMKQIIHTLPKEDIVYFGDTARLPYGEKSQETIIRFSSENSRFLLDKNVKAIVVACSTASSLALDHLRKEFSIPIIGTIHPGAKCAVESSKTGRIAVLGTKGTINSRSFEKTIHTYDKGAFVLPIACPLLVPLVEEHFATHKAAELIVEEYLKPLKENAIDTIILGCTHYPLIKDLIAAVAGPKVTIIDPSLACAETVSRCLAERSLAREASDKVSRSYYVSDDAAKFQFLGKAILGMPIEQVELVGKL